MEEVRRWAHELNNGTPMYIGRPTDIEMLDRVTRGFAPIAENRGIKVYPTGTGSVVAVIRYNYRPRR